jgi:hypothetical protein
MSNIARVWRERLQQETIPHSQATALGHYTVGNGKRNNLTDSEIYELVSRVRSRAAAGDAIKAAPQDTAIGLRWLRDLALTPRGVERKRSPFRYEPDRLQVLLNATHINLVDYSHGRPVYEVVSPSGVFRYFVGTTAAEAMSGGARRHGYDPVYFVRGNPL